ncbi:NUDIX hydrolase [Geodermatophilus sp. SYSU D01119]
MTGVLPGADTSDLPGWLQRLVAASADLPLRHRMPSVTGTARRSAVLVLFGEGPRGADVLLIEKSARLRTHAGQPAFPGGGADPGEDYPVATALREAQEEAGVDPAGVRVLATLPELFLPYSDNLVVPVVAWWDEPADVVVGDPREVARVARVPLADLTDPANRFRVRHPAGYVGPAFDVAGMVVWGFTGGLMEAILEATGLARPWDVRDVRPLEAVAPRPEAAPGSLGEGGAEDAAAPRVADVAADGPPARTVPRR